MTSERLIYTDLGLAIFLLTVGIISFIVGSPLVFILLPNGFFLLLYALKLVKQIKEDKPIIAEGGEKDE
jgi:hypothetical protein